MIIATVGAVLYSCAKKTMDFDDADMLRYYKELFQSNSLRTAFVCVVILSFAITVSNPVVPLQHIQKLATTAGYTLSDVESRGQNYAVVDTPAVKPDLQPEADFALVPIPYLKDCAGQVIRVTCLKLCIANHLGNLKWNVDPSDAFCKELLAGRKDVTHAHVFLCVQHQGRVGAVVQAKSSFNTSAPEFRRGISAQDYQRVLNLLPDGTFRMICRKDLFMPNSLLEPAAWNTYTNHAEAWAKAMQVHNNLGDLIWRYGATHLLNPYTTNFLPESTDALPDALLVPTVNLLYIPTTLNEALPEVVNLKTLGFISLAQKLNVPSALIGIGLQAELPQNGRVSISDAVDSFHLHHASIKLLQEFASRAPAAGFTVRGNLTSHVCRKAGVQACVPIGCPSFMINRARNLGAVLQKQWNNALEKSKGQNSSKMRIAMHLPQLERTGSFHEEVYTLLIRLYAEYDYSMFVLQSDYDYPELQKRLGESRISWNTSRVKFFWSVDEWLYQLKQMDFVIGCRIHGTMAAVAAGTAALILPTDFRTLEMAQAMRIPMISGFELNQLNATSFNLTAVIESIFRHFDFHAFEQTRRIAIQRYSDILSGMDLEIHPELLEILSQS